MSAPVPSVLTDILSALNERSASNYRLRSDAMEKLTASFHALNQTQSVAINTLCGVHSEIDKDDREGIEKISSSLQKMNHEVSDSFKGLLDYFKALRQDINQQNKNDRESFEKLALSTVNHSVDTDAKDMMDQILQHSEAQDKLRRKEMEKLETTLKGFEDRVKNLHTTLNEEEKDDEGKGSSSASTQKGHGTNGRAHRSPTTEQNEKSQCNHQDTVVPKRDQEGLTNTTKPRVENQPPKAAANSVAFNKMHQLSTIEEAVEPELESSEPSDLNTSIMYVAKNIATTSSAAHEISMSRLALRADIHQSIQEMNTELHQEEMTNLKILMDNTKALQNAVGILAQEKDALESFSRNQQVVPHSRISLAHGMETIQKLLSEIDTRSKANEQHRMLLEENHQHAEEHRRQIEALAAQYRRQAEEHIHQENTLLHQIMRDVLDILKEDSNGMGLPKNTNDARSEADDPMVRRRNLSTFLLRSIQKLEEENFQTNANLQKTLSAMKAIQQGVELNQQGVERIQSAVQRQIEQLGVVQELASQLQCNTEANRPESVLTTSMDPGLISYLVKSMQKDDQLMERQMKLTEGHLSNVMNTTRAIGTNQLAVERMQELNGVFHELLRQQQEKLQNYLQEKGRIYRYLTDLSADTKAKDDVHTTALFGASTNPTFSSHEGVQVQLLEQGISNHSQDVFRFEAADKGVRMLDGSTEMSDSVEFLWGLAENSNITLPTTFMKLLRDPTWLDTILSKLYFFTLMGLLAKKDLFSKFSKKTLQTLLWKFQHFELKVNEPFKQFVQEWSNKDNLVHALKEAFDEDSLEQVPRPSSRGYVLTRSGGNAGVA